MNILHLDLETTPAKALVWALFKQTISVDQILEPTSVLCFAAKWNGDKEVQFYKSQKQEGPAFERMIKKAHELLSQADAVSTFNGVSFDIPRLNTEFVKLGLPPPPPFANIDLKTIVMKKFAMTSSKLAFVGPYLKLGAKVRHEGWDLWKDCMRGDPKAWQIMQAYNIMDVILLEKLYNRVLPWIDNHPNRNLFVDSEEPVCTNCGKATLQKRGEAVTTTQRYTRYACTTCGRWCRGRNALKPKRPVAVR